MKYICKSMQSKKFCCLPMNPFFIFITAFVVLFTYVDADQRKHKCKRPEIWEDCGGCELKCGQSDFAPCALRCNPPGCYCSPFYGLRRDSSGKCISKHQCPTRKHLNAPEDFILETDSVTFRKTL
uniref:Serine protease inhibitor 2 n=2 Tax=Onchocerca volvulus TaxID=6282 RepID=A0A8R1TMB0_ONCVO